MSQLQIKKLTNTAIIPTRGSDGAAGFDLYADSVEGQVSIATEKDGSQTVICGGGSNIKIHTGIAMAIPKGYVGLLFARSGLSCKQGLRPANCVGVIDEDYRGEIIVQLYNDADFAKFYNADTKIGNASLKNNDVSEQFSTFKLHDRVAQMVFVKYEAFDTIEVDELDNTIRGENGFGSTGTN